jgi:predicted CxxxxCH...CXXCH cytochrome family protein
MAKGGWRTGSFLEAIACVSGGAPATVPATTASPIVRALENETHRSITSDAEKALIVAWVEAGAPAFAGTVHGPGIIDPRSPAWHGKLLSSRGFRPMFDGNDADACGRCHDGTPARPANVTSPAPGATACTKCHNEPQGVLACNTCHGMGGVSRDPCFFPQDAATSGAHRAHLAPSTTRPPFTCSTCHPTPGANVIGGVHGNGSVEIAFDERQVGSERNYDRAAGACGVSCHDRGGARPRPHWTESEAMKCTDCHGAPPAGHYRGSCKTCHKQANSDGSGLFSGMLHLNGKIDLGDGSGGCGACHGSGQDPWPTTAAHPAHKSPTLAAPIECTTCHAVPTTIHDPGHMNGTVEVTLSELALARGAKAIWDGKSCNQVACHGAVLRDVPAVTPVWTDTTEAARACGACHGIPPSQHTASISCDRSTCHGSEVDRTLTTIAISPAGRALHANGTIDAVGP